MSRLIINTTAVRNNGDVALLRALSEALEARGHTVLFATPQPELMSELHGMRNVCRDVAGYHHPAFRWPFFCDLAAILLLLSPEYRRADAIIGAPGGYINSYYGFDWRRAIFRWARRFGKKTAVYAQSVGPFTREQARSLAAFGGEVDLLMTRDNLSKSTAVAAGFPTERLLPSVDAIFLKAPAVSPASSRSNVVAISVREWAHDGRDVARYSGMVCKLAQLLLARGFQVEFISTCQGIKEYIDDAVLASRIAQQVRDESGQAVALKVIAEAHGISELLSRLPAYRAIVGTRLHMCLLGMLAGVPAFNISYESKGRECYGYLGLAEFSIDYNEDERHATRQLEHFLGEEKRLRRDLPVILQGQHLRAVRDLDEFLTRLKLPGPENLPKTSHVPRESAES